MMDPWAAAASHGTAAGIELALIRNKILTLRIRRSSPQKRGFLVIIF